MRHWVGTTRRWKRRRYLDRVGLGRSLLSHTVSWEALLYPWKSTAPLINRTVCAGQLERTETRFGSPSI
jgi:hypothetical protein